MAEIRKPRVRSTNSKAWEQILTNDRYNKPDTINENIRRHCDFIEMTHDDRYSYNERGKVNIEKLYKKYEDLGQRLVNEARISDWNGVEKKLSKISIEMKGHCELKTAGGLILYYGRMIPADDFGVVMDKPILKHKQKELKDHQTLISLGIKSGATLHMQPHSRQNHQQHQELNDNETLSSLGIKSGATLHMQPHSRSK